MRLVIANSALRASVLMSNGIILKYVRTFCSLQVFFPCPLGTRKNTMQLAKYPLVLYVKPFNNVYFLYGLPNKTNLRLLFACKTDRTHTSF